MRARGIHLHHSLVDEGILSGLTDDQISPLYYDNGCEECSVTSVLQGLPLIESLPKIRKQSLIQVQITDQICLSILLVIGI